MPIYMKNKSPVEIKLYLRVLGKQVCIKSLLFVVPLNWVSVFRFLLSIHVRYQSSFVRVPPPPGSVY